MRKASSNNKNFYASGFLFHLKSQQILLHQQKQKNDTVSLWSMFGGPSSRKKDPAAAFQQIIYNKLKLKLEKECIYPIYDYFHDVLHKTHYVYYAKVKKMQDYTFGKDTLSWFTFKQTLKLSFTQQTKQDIIVAQRVIEAAQRITAHTQYYRPSTA